MQLILYLAVAGCLALASADMSGQRCCSPEKMEMKGGYSGGTGPTNPSLIEAEMVVLAYDYSTQMVAVIENVYVNSGPAMNVTAIMDYSKGMNYYIINGRCQREVQKIPIKPRCIPNESKYNGRVRVGSSKAGLDVDSWTLGFDLEKVAGVTSSMYEPESCLPVTDYTKMYDKETKQGSTSSLMYFDVKPSISDMSIFNVPDICKNAPFK